MSGKDKSGLEDKKYLFVHLATVPPFGYCWKSVFWRKNLKALFIYQ